MKTRLKTAGLALFAGTAIFIASPSQTMAAALPKGISAGGINLENLTIDEASEKIKNYITDLQKEQVIIDNDGTAYKTTADKLGLAWINEDAIDELKGYCEDKNLVRQYMQNKDLENQPLDLEIKKEFSKDKVKEFLQTSSADSEGAAKNAEIKRENGQFVITPEKEGKTIDTEATFQELSEALKADPKSEIKVSAVVTIDKPKITKESLSQIKDVLGTFSTDFSSSGAARSTNLRVGAGKINGHVLFKGETLSGYECMQPFTTDNGYETSKAYENGMVVDSVGGGVCQIATTLYNAALRAELTITQRQNHSMAVGYVKPSEDAAIAGTYKDIKITNPYDTPIYVEGYTQGKTLVFTIYGKETRPSGREIKFVSETLKTIDPGEPTVKQDPTMAAGTRVTEQTAHTGIKSRLWKYVYENGVEKEKTMLSEDTYNPSKSIVRVGTAVPAAAPVPVETQPQPQQPETPAETTAPVETQAPQPVEGILGGPGVSISNQAGGQ